MKRFLLILTLTALVLPARADWAGEFRYYVYGSEQGLCDEYVLNTYKDRNGYLWACTSNGLDRFDGNRFVHFSSHSADARTRIENDFIYGVAEDGNGCIWAVSNAGLMRISCKEGTVSFSKDLWQESDLLTLPMNGIQADGDRLLWVLQRDGLVAVELDEKSAVTRVEKYPAPSTSLRYMSVGENVIWVGGFDGVSCFRKGRAGQLEAVPGPENPKLADIRDVSTVLIQGNYLWIGTEDGLFCYDVRSRSLTTFQHDRQNPSSLSDDHVTCLAADSSGDILVGTSRGIDHFTRAGKFGHITQGRPRKSLNTNYVNHILVDRDGTLWVSTLVGGINQITPKNVMEEDILSVTEGISNIVACNYEDRDGNLLMGILGKGLGIRRAGQDQWKSTRSREKAACPRRTSSSSGRTTTAITGWPAATTD